MDLEGKTCVKCDLDAKFTGVDPKKAWYCAQCFVAMVRNKFRSSLSKKRIYNDAGDRKTLVVFDGTPSAAFLLAQVDDALKQINFKRLMIEPTVLVLISVQETQKIEHVMEKIAELKEKTLEKCSWIIGHVAYSMHSEHVPSIQEGTCNGVDKIPHYNDLLNSCPSPTYRNELRRILREKALENFGKAIGISKCMIPDDADDLGRLAIDQLCLGRGGSLSSLVSVLDKRPTYSLIRPLKEISKKEIGIYNHLSKIDENSVQIEDQQFGKTDKSVQILTDQFIRTLEAEKFYSTINTVLSTASKIHDSSSQSNCTICYIESGPICATCQSIKDNCTVPLSDLFIKL